MNKLWNICAAILTALVLTACGGSSDGGSAPPNAGVTDVGSLPPPPPTPTALPPLPPPPPLPPAATVTFKNVPTNSQKISVVPGERDVIVAAFEMEWKDPQQRGAFSQIVYKNPFADSRGFRDFKLVDSDGNDVTLETPYSVRRDDAKHQVIVDFYQFPWFPNDFGIVPKVYTLLAYMDPSVPVGTKFAFQLTAAQMHDAGQTAASEVKGGEYKVVDVEGMGLPIVSSFFPANYAFAPNSLGMFIPAAVFTVTCPAGNIFACQFVNAKLLATGVSEPVLAVDGIFIGSTRGIFPDDVNSFKADVNYVIFPGETKSFVIFFTVFQTNVWLTVTDMEFVVGSAKVSPVIAILCGLFADNTGKCNGKG